MKKSFITSGPVLDSANNSLHSTVWTLYICISDFHIKNFIEVFEDFSTFEETCPIYLEAPRRHMFLCYNSVTCNSQTEILSEFLQSECQMKSSDIHPVL